MVLGRLRIIVYKKQRNSSKITRRDRRFRNRKAAESGCNVVGTGCPADPPRHRPLLSDDLVAAFERRYVTERPR
jgi:hypothetical protein